jgi:hypothetical protein
MDVKQGSFRSLCGIRWPVLGSVRSDVQTHRLRRLRQRTSALFSRALGGIRQVGHPKNSTRFASGALLDMKDPRKDFWCLL